MVTGLASISSFLHLFITARKRSLRRLCFYRCLSFCPGGGACMVAREVSGYFEGVGVCGCSGGGVCGCSGGHAWLLWGACMVALGGHAWLLGGMHGCSQGGCAWLLRGCAWLLLGGHVWDTMRYGDTINEQAVRILLECILVS